MGKAEMRIAEPERRDQLLLISAFAMALLAMFGMDGDGLGMERLLKSITSKTRSHSLFRHGCMLCELIPDLEYAKASAPAIDKAVRKNAAQQRHIWQYHAGYEMRKCVRLGPLVRATFAV